MPVGLGLEVPDWGDDSGAWAAPAKLKSSSDKGKRNLVPSAAPLKTESKAGKGTASAKRATTAPAPAGKPLSSTREDTIVGKKRKLAEAVAAVPEHLRHMLIMPTDDDAETPSVGRSEDGGGSKRKRKKRKGKHTKNKDDKAPTLTQDSSPPPQRVGEGGAGASGGLIDTKKKGKKDEGKKNAAATPPPQKQKEGTAAAKPRPAAELEVHGDGAGTGAPKKKKKRKRKNKFQADQEGGEGAGAKATSEAGGQGGAGAEESRKGDGGGKKRKKAGEEQSGVKESPGPGGAKSGGPGKDKSVAQGGTGKAGSHQVERGAEGQKGGDSANDGAERKFPFKGAGAVAANRRLTPLQAKLAKKLQGAHFRMLNEELYTTPSAAAQAMFDKDPSLFTTYHEGFRSQVTKWPVNPVDVIIKFLKKHPTWTVADLGCGDAKIALTLPAGRVHSFDLVAVNDRVKACDIAHVPLADGAVDVAVLSLALMGTNYPQFLREANRVVKANGRVLVAEVKSRCEHVLDAFVALLEGMGLRVDEVDKNNKMFIMFYLTKVRACGKLGALQPPELKACQYKKR